jgi:PAS domain S-box-containing protein
MKADANRNAYPHLDVETALQESKECFSLLLECVTDYAIIMLDPQGRVISWNRGAERLKGYQAEEILGKHFSCFYPREARDQAWPEHELQQAASKGRFEDEGWRVRKDGSQFWANVVITAIRDQTGSIRGFAKITRDMSERKKAEETLAQKARESQEELAKQTKVLRSILDSMAEGVVVADKDGKFLHWNPAAQQLLGLGAADVPPTEWAEVYGTFLSDGITPCPTEDLPLVKAMHGESVDGVELVIRNPHLTHPLWINVTARPLINDKGERVGGVAVFFDDTQRKLATEVLRASEEKTRLIVETAFDPFIAMDSEGLIIDWNAKASATFGWSREEALGRPLAETILPVQYRQAHTEGLKRFLATGQGPVLNKRIEITALRRDGHEFPVELTIAPLRWEHKDIFSAFVHDITERKAAEEAIGRLNQELDQRVTERTAELADANAELMQKNQENETFVYSVSHDLRSPLVNLQGFSRELGLACGEIRAILADANLPAAVQNRGLNLMDRDMAESIQFIQSAVMRLSSIIDALLRLSRAGRLELQWQPVDLNATISRIVDAMNATVTERGARVSVKDLPIAWGDATVLEQIFANLIGNALNYLDPRRPGVIEVGCQNFPSAPDSRVNGPWIFYVKDNGLGIPDSYQHKIFQAFQRLHPEAAKGEGMGLAIVRRFVERHGGKIWLESTLGAGTTFFVALPIEPANNGTAKELSDQRIIPALTTRSEAYVH